MACQLQRVLEKVLIDGEGAALRGEDRRAVEVPRRRAQATRSGYEQEAQGVRVRVWWGAGAKSSDRVMGVMRVGSRMTLNTTLTSRRDPPGRWPT